MDQAHAVRLIHDIIPISQSIADAAAEEIIRKGLVRIPV